MMSRSRYRAPRAEQFSPKVYALTDSRWNQLWRNQLLCEAIKTQEARDLAAQVVVFPAGMDTTAALVQEYASLLSRPDAVHARTLPEVLSAIEPATQLDDRPWLQAFRARYIDLDLSTALFEAWKSSRAPFDL